MEAILNFMMGPVVYAAIAAVIVSLVVRCIGISKKYKAGTLTEGYLNIDISKKSSIIAVVILHASFLVLLFGHSRMIGDIPLLLKIVPVDFLNSSGHVFGCILGVFLTCVFIFLLYKRMQKEGDNFTTDYIFLSMALILILLGCYLQFAQPYSLAVYREYVSSLLHFSPALPKALTSSANVFFFSAHVLLACATAIVFIWSNALEHMAYIAWKRKND